MTPRRSLTLRVRWALVSAALVTVSGVVVLVLSLVLTDRLLHDRAHQTLGQPTTAQPAAAQPGAGAVGGGTGGAANPLGLPPPAGPDPQQQARLDAGHDVTEGVIADVRRVDLITMGVLALASVGIGWLVAGRMLRPLDRITAAAESVSGARLGDRITLDGPDDELGRLAATFNAMLDRLDVAFDAQRSFVADASHELRTPLAVMRAEVEVALDDPDADRDALRASLQATLVTLEDTSALVDRLLHLSRADTLASVGVVDLAGSAAKAIDGALVVAAGCEPSTHAALAQAEVRGDGVLLDRMAGNLVENAVRHNRADGSVWVWTGIEDGSSVLTVENDGPVVSPDEVAGLFARFQRRRETLAAGTVGSGLGLAIVAAVARTHGGTVQATPRDDGGLRVEVRLPHAVGQ
jgi:signal transduction histidine kinase